MPPLAWQRDGVATDERRLLTAPELSTLGDALPQWRVDGDVLVRVAKAPDFMRGIAWVVAVADAAESMDHHPDIDIRYRTLTFRLTTHDLGGLSTWDLGLARRIDAVVDSPGG